MTRDDQFAVLPQHRAERWAKFGRWDTPYYPKFLGLDLEEVRLDYARMRLPFRPEFLQPAGVWHGGAIASLIDTVVVPAVGSGYDDMRAMFTIDLQLRYLAPIPEGADAVAEGWITRRGRSTLFCDAEVFVNDIGGELAATATLVYKVSSKTTNAT